MRKPPPQKPADVPVWILTYTDVITLLMTFFILLLTFATSEPEAFEKMRTYMFERPGVAGLVGDTKDEIERDAWVYRVRPSLARLGINGSEVPPAYQDPGGTTVREAVAGLDSEENRDPTVSRVLEVPLAMVVSERGEVTPSGRQLMHVLAYQLRKLPLHICLTVAHSRDLPRLMSLVEYLTGEEKVVPGKIGASLCESLQSQSNHVRILITWHAQE
jgi:hypothetical protein